VGKLAERNQVSGQRIYQIILGDPAASAVRENQGTGLEAGLGGGPGRKTLGQYCQEQGLAVADAVARLEANGIHATETLTLREIALKHGYDKPYEILDIINSQ